MPKVLRIINRLNLGGPTFNVAYLTKHLAPEFETLLVSGMIDSSEASSEFIVKDLGLNPTYIEEMYREISFLKDRAAYDKIRAIIREFKPDIVHTHAAKAGAVGRLAAIHEKVPVVLHTFHGHVFHSYFSPLKTRIFLEIERYLGKRSTGIIAISDLQKRELTEQFKVVKKEKVEVIPLGFDLTRFVENQSEKRINFRSKWQLNDETLAIGIIGRLVPVKNHSLFLEAAKHVLEKTSVKVRFFIIGDGESKEEIVLKAKDVNIQYDLHESTQFNAPLTFTSWMKDVDVALAGLDIVCLTSNNEGTPVSLIEAQAAGKPIVTTDAGGIKDVVLENQSALVSLPGDVESFSKNLLKMVEDHKMRNDFASKGSAHVLKKYTYTRLVDDMATYYRKLLSNHS